MQPSYFSRGLRDPEAHWMDWRVVERFTAMRIRNDSLPPFTPAPDQAKADMDALIFGGGAAGLWLLAELIRRGHSALLLEATALGSGQTAASQGIIHGGLKYALQGLLTPAAQQIRDMPSLWRACLGGTGLPNLSQTRVRSQHCHLWRTNSLTSRLGMFGAQIGLRIAPKTIPESERPAALASCPGTVARLDEQVVSPTSFIADLANQYRDRILHVEPERNIEFRISQANAVLQVLLKNGTEEILLNPRWVVLTAGETLGCGNDCDWIRRECSGGRCTWCWRAAAYPPLTAIALTEQKHG